jgi:hypothetical protein
MIPICVVASTAVRYRSGARRAFAWGARGAVGAAALAIPLNLWLQTPEHRLLITTLWAIWALLAGFAWAGGVSLVAPRLVRQWRAA